ncbi:hypothetical protein E1742_23365 [Pseudoduganella plicata]|uniref:Uncharacterized protein n=1 Tax=Pseudoduganella plicata TaxID=321984 RepID=A0ABX5SJ28_9BURK|nr:hypothetical protein E1742_23365 [Pseudoduganella plicata]
MTPTGRKVHYVAKLLLV